MDIIDRIRELAARIPKQREIIQTEEATKNAFIMPFISLLGYDVFNPTEVTPEFNADIGVKKGEKVDYAILKEGKPTILFECKHHSVDLKKTHASQLYRYFSVTDARFGVLTNGVVYCFFTDLDAPNKMDERPFFEFNLLDFKDSSVDELKKFSKATFNISTILTTANELKYTRVVPTSTPRPSWATPTRGWATPTRTPSWSTPTPFATYTNYTPPPSSNCSPSYPDVCIPPPPPDLDCADIPYRRFRVLPPDPHRFDRNHDGIGCES